MITWLPTEQAIQLMKEELAKRTRFKAYLDAAIAEKERRGPQPQPAFASQMAQRTLADNVTAWGHAAPWLPRSVYMPLAKANVAPDSDLGMAVIRHSPIFNGPRHATVNAAAHQGPLTAQAGVQSPSFVQAGLGNIGGGFQRIGSAIGAVTEPVRRGLDISQAQQNITAERAHLPRVDQPVKSATRFVGAALQAGAEASDTALTYRSPYAGRDWLSGDRYVPPTENPFSLKQFTLYQMLNGANAGSGYFPGGEAQQRAAEAQREIRGTIAGHARTPGRVFASQFFEPGSFAYNAASGVIDAGVDWRTDPAALALTGLGDVNQARKLIDVAGSVDAEKAYNSYGLVSAHRNWLARKIFDTSLDGDPARRTLENFANNKNTREIWHALGKRTGSLSLARDLANTTTVDDVKNVLKLHASEVPTIPKWGYNFSYAASDLRWAHAMSSGRISPNDIDNAAEQLERMMVAGKVPSRVIDQVISQVPSTAGDMNKFADVVYNGVGRTIEHTLVNDYGIEPSRAKEVTSFFRNQSEDDRIFHVREMANDPHPLALTTSDGPVPITGPVAASQHLNSEIGIPNVRDIRKAATAFKPLLEMPGFEQTHTFLDYFTDLVFKPGALLRLAWPVRVIAEEQVRMAAAGLDSLFHHPINYIGWTIGRKGATDAAEIPWEIDPEDVLSQVLAGGATYRGLHAGANPETEKMFAKHMDLIGKESPNFARSWADELSMHHMDPVNRAAARSVQAGAGSQALKDSFWDGALSKVRKNMADGGGWREHLLTREGADSYIDDIAIPWIERSTQGHADVLDMIVNGGIRRDMKLNPQAVRRLANYTERGLSPESVMGSRLLATEDQLSKAGRAGEKYNAAVDKMFSVLMGKPTNYLSRSVAFKQFYWRKIADSFGNIDEDTQKQLVRVAQNNRLPGDLIAKMRFTGKSGDVGLEAIDAYAKAHAIDATKNLLYDLSKRSNFFDSMRVVFPFGEAWKEVLTVWSKLAVEQPQVARRFQQVIQGARQSSFFYTDPQDGQEYFTFPFSQFLTQKVAGVPFPLRGRVSGLNIIGQGLPGVGPAVQIPLSSMIPDKPQWDAVRDVVSPYGTPDNAGAFLPGWAQKLQATNWLEDSTNPVLGTIGRSPVGAFARTLFPQAENQKRIFENVMKDVMAYQASTGAYDPRDPNDLARMLADAKQKAIGLYAIRSAAQSVAPAAPAFVPKVKAKDGKLYELYRMAKDYRDLQDADFETATQKFIDKYGAKAFLAAVPKSVQQVYNPPVTTQQKRWEAANQKFVDAYPQVSGFFGPTSGDHDYDAYLRALDKGQIEQLSPNDWARAANQRLAASIYAQKRAMVGASPNKAQEEWLREWRAQLEHDYTGYSSTGSAYGKNIEPADARRQLFDAANDKSHKDIYGSMFAKSVREYEGYRQQALNQAKAAGLNSLDSPRTEPLRAWLREWGDELSQQTPQFQAAWDYLLYGEVRIED